MPTAVIQEQKKKRRKIGAKKRIPRQIPESLVYERVNQIPIYYRGYQEVIKGKKQVEEIMGSSFVQSFLISRLVRFLIAHLPDIYEVLTNELGIQFSKGHWCAADIAIYAKTQLRKIPLHNQYLDIPPQIVIEVDTKADLDAFLTTMDYYYTKTDALLAFGVEKVIWIFTDAKKVMIAEPQKDWITRGWDQDLHIIDDVTLKLSELLITEH